ncbi:MAG: hypothetical protein KKA64_03665 [Nanoarchaeota archaeon]|nr:hypothetical protein [Nanoarchaeota archaeon]
MDVKELDYNIRGDFGLLMGRLEQDLSESFKDIHARIKINGQGRINIDYIGVNYILEYKQREGKKGVEYVEIMRVVNKESFDKLKDLVNEQIIQEGIFKGALKNLESNLKMYESRLKLKRKIGVDSENNSLTLKYGVSSKCYDSKTGLLKNIGRLINATEKYAIFPAIMMAFLLDKNKSGKKR